MKPWLKWLGRLLIVAMALGVLALVFYLGVLPGLVQRRVVRALRDAGLTNPAITLRAVSLREAQFANLSAEGDGNLRVGAIHVTYDLTSLWQGRIHSLELVGGEYRLALDTLAQMLKAPASAPANARAPGSGVAPGQGAGADSAWPLDRLEVRASALILDWPPYQIRLPLEGVLATAPHGQANLDLTLSALVAPVHLKGVLQPWRDGQRNFKLDMDVMHLALAATGSYQSPSDFDLELNSPAREADAPATRPDLAAEQGWLQARYRSRHGSKEGSLLLDATLPSWNAASLGLPLSLAGGRLIAHGAVHDGPGDVLGLDVRLDQFQLGSFAARSLELAARQENQTASIDLRATGEDWTIHLDGSSPGSLLNLLDPSGRQARGFLHIQGHTPASLSQLLASMLALEIPPDLPVAVQARGIWEARWADKPWVVQWSDMNLAIAMDQASMPSYGMVGKGLKANLVMEGQIDQQGLIARLASGSGLAWQSLDFVKPALTLAAGSAAVEEDQQAPFLRASWAGPEPGWQLSGRLLTDNPALSGASAKASAHRLEIVADLSRKQGRLAVAGKVDIQDGQCTLPGADLAFKGISASIPLVWHGTPVEAGDFAIAWVTWADHAWAGLTGTLCFSDGQAPATLRWQALRDLSVQAQGSLDFRGDYPVGQIEVPALRMSFDQLKRLAVIGPLIASALQGWKAQGEVELQGRATLEQGRWVPWVRLALVDAGLQQDLKDGASFQGLNGQLVINSFDPLASPADQRFTIDRVDSGDLHLSEGTLALQVESAHSVLIESTLWHWGRQGRLSSRAIRFDPQNPRLRAEILVEDLALEDWLKLITAGRMSGQGLLYGRIPLTLRARPMWGVVFHGGFLYANPGGGRLQVLDTQAMQDQLIGQGTNEVLQDVERKAMQALTDMNYSTLAFEFIPQDGDFICRIRTSGKGRQGLNPVEYASLTVNIHGFAQVLNAGLGLSRLGQGLGREAAPQESKERQP